MSARRKPRERSNALVSSHGYWTRLRPNCHPDAKWDIIHSTLAGYYEIQCASCGGNYIRIEVGVAR